MNLINKYDDGCSDDIYVNDDRDGNSMKYCQCRHDFHHYIHYHDLLLSFVSLVIITR